MVMAILITNRHVLFPQIILISQTLIDEDLLSQNELKE
jgi:hypothetical protein